MTIHSDHPFIPDRAERDAMRRFRGRLAAPVTIATAGTEEKPAGLTVSSLIVVEGEPPALKAVIGPTSDLWYAIEETGRFVVHVSPANHGARADVFAGLRPSPGGPFANVPTEISDWGPVITDIGDRAYCRMTLTEEIGYSGMVSAVVDRFDLTEMSNPLVYFRGRYRNLG